MTSKQLILLKFIHKQIIVTGCAPSFREMMDYMLLSSKSNITRTVNSLQERGFLTRIHYKARSLELTESGLARVGKSGCCPTCGHPLEGAA